jgi:hypothetical protein
MPNGNKTFPLYFGQGAADREVLEFIDALPPGEKSRWIKRACREKMADGGMGVTMEAVRQVFRDEIATLIRHLPNLLYPSGENF